jgi:hypothetical protein
MMANPLLEANSNVVICTYVNYCYNYVLRVSPRPEFPACWGGGGGLHVRGWRAGTLPPMQCRKPPCITPSPPAKTVLPIDERVQRKLHVQALVSELNEQNRVKLNPAQSLQHGAETLGKELANGWIGLLSLEDHT